LGIAEGKRRGGEALVLGDSQVMELGERVGWRKKTDGKRRGLAVNWHLMEQAELVVGHSRRTKLGSEALVMGDR